LVKLRTKAPLQL